MAFDPTRAKALFLAASDLAAADRGAFLDRECAGDDELRARVEELLEVRAMPQSEGDSGASETVDSSIGQGIASGSTTSAAAPQDQAGTVLAGKYKLLEPIGEGGMGSVWLAQQSEPVKRRVAVKLIKLGMDSRQVLSRFEAERQALAMMDHPNIAKVLDGGLAPDGRPFFVMELVKGTPITDFCDANKLGIKERLDLFVPVCQAIQHAHQKGIIHRDIKPSNVMIALYDDRPVPKVIDFGVAKATGGALTEQTLETGFGGIVGTPHYMSPEQATFNNVDIDTRSDVYSLGVLLYELLAGSPPFSRDELEEKGMMEMLRVVREDEPPKPSTKLSTAAALPTLSANRGSEPRKLTALLRSELDWIVLKSLEKNRARRYETANGLAADVQRYLSGEPVLAHPPSAAYRASKFVRKHRAQVIAASVVAAALVLGVIGTSAGLARAVREKNRAETENAKATLAAESEAKQRVAAEAAAAEAAQQRDEAKSLNAIAEAVAHFQTDMLSAADPNKLMGDKVTVVQAMEAATSELDKGALKDQPLVEIRVRDAIGNTLSNLGRYDAAEPHLRRKLALVRANFPAGHPGIANSISDLVMVLEAQNKLSELEPLLREALAIHRAALPAGDPSIAVSLNNLATLLQVQGRLAEAEPLAREAVAIHRKAFPAGSPEIATDLGNLAGLLRAQGKLAEAEPLFREALEIDRKALPAGHPDIATDLNNLAGLLLSERKPSEAEALYRESLAMRRAALPAGHPDIAQSLNSLATVLQAQNKLAEAEPIYREALEIRRKSLPAGHPDIARSLSSLAGLLQAQNRFAEAAPLYREALEVDRASLPKDSLELAGRLATTGLNLLQVKAWPEAEPLLRESLAIREAKTPDDWRAFAAKSMLGGALLGQGKLAEAEPLLLDGYAGLKQREAAIPPQAAARIPEALERLVRLYEAKGNAPEAAAWRGKLGAARATTLPATLPAK